ncbi:unnamed protein product [Amoebophrya sp. A25]|nr:unnamed protein product [Amoebophrya sp. A25]|eukprot:GSA25T00010976001.1
MSFRNLNTQHPREGDFDHTLLGSTQGHTTGFPAPPQNPNFSAGAIPSVASSQHHVGTSGHQFNAGGSSGYKNQHGMMNQHGAASRSSPWGAPPAGGGAFSSTTGGAHTREQYGNSSSSTGSPAPSQAGAESDRCEQNIKSIIERLQEEARLALEELLVSSTNMHVLYHGEYRERDGAYRDFLKNSKGLVDDGRSLFRDWQVVLAGERHRKKLAYAKLEQAFESEVSNISSVQRQVENALDDFEAKKQRLLDRGAGGLATGAGGSSGPHKGGAGGGMPGATGGGKGSHNSSGKNSMMAQHGAGSSSGSGSSVGQGGLNGSRPTVMELSPRSYRLAHEDYSSSLRHRDGGGHTAQQNNHELELLGPNDLDFWEPSAGQGGAGPHHHSDVHAMQQQMQEEQDAQMAARVASERQQGIQRIVGQVGEVQKIFQDLATVVQSQGEQIMNIEQFTQGAADHIGAGANELRTVAERKKQRQNKMVVMVLVAALLFLCFLLWVASFVGSSAPPHQSSSASPASVAEIEERQAMRNANRRRTSR